MKSHCQPTMTNANDSGDTDSGCRHNCRPVSIQWHSTETSNATSDGCYQIRAYLIGFAHNGCMRPLCSSFFGSLAKCGWLGLETKDGTLRKYRLSNLA